MRTNKMMIAALLALLFCICGVFLNEKASFAADSGYVISDYNVKIQVHKNAVFTVTENITADFLQQRHGIKRYIPTTQSMTITDSDSGNDRTYYYSTPISNIKVNGAPFELSDDKDDPSGYKILKIGDPAEWVKGSKEYEISYDFDMGDDRLMAYDLFYFDIIGPDWDTKIKSVEFLVEFDKDVDLSKTKIYSGKIGNTNTSEVEFTIEGNTVAGKTWKALKSNEALTMYVELPAGYYENMRRYNSDIPLVTLALLCIVTVIIVVWRIKKRQTREIVQTVEFYPPDGVTSAEVGYIIDGSADDKDLLSLFIWLADKGYLTINDKEEKMTFTKCKEIESDQPEYMQIFFNGLFVSGHTVSLKSLKSGFYDTLATAKRELRKFFFGERKLSDGKTAAVGVLASIVSVVLGAIGLISHVYALDGVMIFCAIGFLVFAFLAGLLIKIYIGNRYFGKGKILVVIAVIFVIFALGFAVLSSFLNTFGEPMVLRGLYTVTLFNIIFGPTLHQFTDYKIDMTGKLLGLREFIKEAELERLQMLVDENPSYFYHILPYAYVFGLTKKWMKQFESIAIAQPTWYYGDMYPFTSIYFINRINHLTHETTRQMQEVSAARAKSSGSSGGGGGGFSGGGFGGGGGSSW